MLLDSNILIYAAKPGGEVLRQWLAHPQACLSIISRIEVLGFHGLAAPEQSAIAATLSGLPELPLDDEVAAQAIGLRQAGRIGLADAIIARTALRHRLPLVTRNTDDFKHIAELRLINPYGEN